MTEDVDGNATTGLSNFTFPDEIFPTVREPFPALPLSPKEKLARLIIDYNDDVYPNGTSSEKKHVKIRFRWAREVLNFADSQGSDMPEELVQVARSVILEACSYNDNKDLENSEGKEETKTERATFEIYQKFIPPALYIIGQWCLFGSFSLPVDKQKAIELFSLSAKLGYSRAYYRIASEFESAGDIRKALKYYRVGLKQSDSACLFRLGMAYLRGHLSLGINKSQGLRYIRDASIYSDPDSPLASYIYGLIQLGELLHISEPDLSLLEPEAGETTLSQVGLTAVERAAWLGFPPALIRMGKAWQGGERGYDSTIALRYFHLAARQQQYRRFNGEAVKSHNGEAEIEIAKWFLSGSDEGGFKPNEEWAFKFSMMGAELGNAVAQFAIGYYYEVGIWVRLDLATAKIWYVKAAANDSKDAQEKVKELNQENPKLVTRNHHERLMSLNGRNSIRSKGRYKRENKNIHSKRFSSYELDSDLNLPNKSRTASPIKELYEDEEKEQHKPIANQPREEKPLPSSPCSNPKRKLTEVSRKPVLRVPIGAKSLTSPTSNSITVSPYSSKPIIKSTKDLTNQMYRPSTDDQDKPPFPPTKTDFKQLPSLPAQYDLDDDTKSLDEDILSDTQKILGAPLESSNPNRGGRKTDWLFDNLKASSSSAGFPFGYEDLNEIERGHSDYNDIVYKEHLAGISPLLESPTSISSLPVNSSMNLSADSDSSSTRTITVEYSVQLKQESSLMLPKKANPENPSQKSYDDIYSIGYTSLDPASSGASLRSTSQSKKRIPSESRKAVGSDPNLPNPTEKKSSISNTQGFPENRLNQLNPALQNINLDNSLIEKALSSTESLVEVGKNFNLRVAVPEGKFKPKTSLYTNVQLTANENNKRENFEGEYGSLSKCILEQDFNNIRDSNHTGHFNGTDNIHTSGFISSISSAKNNDLIDSEHILGDARLQDRNMINNANPRVYASQKEIISREIPAPSYHPPLHATNRNVRYQQRPRSVDYSTNQYSHSMHAPQIYNRSQAPTSEQPYISQAMPQGYRINGSSPTNNNGRSMSLANGPRPDLRSNHSRQDNFAAYDNSQPRMVNAVPKNQGHPLTGAFYSGPEFSNPNIRSRSASPLKNYYSGQGPAPTSFCPPQSFNINGRPRSTSPFKNNYPGQAPPPGYGGPNMRMRGASPVPGIVPMGIAQNIRPGGQHGYLGNPPFRGPSPLSGNNAHNQVSTSGGNYHAHPRAPPFAPPQSASDAALLNIPVADPGYSKRGLMQGGDSGLVGIPPAGTRRNNNVAARNNLLSQF